MLVSNQSSSVRVDQPRFGGDSKAAAGGGQDSRGASVEATPTWFQRNKIFASLGVLALATTMMAGCKDDLGPLPAGQQHDPVRTEQVVQPQPKAAPVVAQPVALHGCDLMKSLNAKATPADATEAASLTADRDVAKADCQVEIAQKQTEAAQKMAAAAERQADAAQRSADAQKRQADAIKQEQDFRNAQRAGEAAGAIGGALMDGLNGILH